MMENVRFCPNCGAKSDDGAQSCARCGAVFHEQEPLRCQKCGNSVHAQDSFCARCGDNLVEQRQERPEYCRVCGSPFFAGASFCHQCGHPVPKAGDEDDPSEITVYGMPRIEETLLVYAPPGFFSGRPSIR